MGRAMLFLVSGSFIIFGMIELGVFGRQASMNEMNVQSALTAQARNVANSGLERALNRLITEVNWRAEPANPTRFAFGDEFADIVVVDGTMDGITLPPGIVEVRSTGSSGNQVATATAQIEVQNGLPDINGAMGIFTDNLSVSISGSSFLISGDDRNPDGTAGMAGSLPGIAVNSTNAFEEFMNSTNNSQRGRIQGEEPPPTLFGSLGSLLGSNIPSLFLNEDMDGDALEDFVQLAIANADETYTDHTASGANSLGSVENPKIIVIDGTLNVSNATGAGIIIIREGGSLDARGNFDNYQGLIIVQGNADLTRGNIHIVGAMLFGGANPSIEIDIDFRGNVNIQYSSLALQNLNTRLPTTAGFSQRLLAIYD